jgi:hypothetical protein
VSCKTGYLKLPSRTKRGKSTGIIGYHQEIKSSNNRCCTRREPGAEDIFKEIMNEYFSKMEVDYNPCRGRSRSSIKLNPNRSSPRHIIIRLKNHKKEKILRPAKDKKHTAFLMRAILTGVRQF